MAELHRGERAPGFTLSDQHGRSVRLEDLRGRSVLVYFFPKADTPGCTIQSCDLRDHLPDLGGLSVDVVGISPDVPEDQLAFDRKYGLGFPLLSDPDHAVAEAWGAWGERVRGGTTTIGIIRSAFLVDGDGRIEHAWHAVRPEDTVPNALAALHA
ncbi:MAG TPA: thioredoxin-dependent thiol peroxidase [Actinomycetota bacterium]|nr:thioredoxin-dependent thiol peroxidase [Actinomycetota bacterium]